MTYQIDGLVTGADLHTSGSRAHDAWRDWCNTVHGEFDISFHDDGYRGSVIRQRSSDYQMVSWTSESETVRRNARGIRHDPRGHYELFMPLQGPLYVGDESADRALMPGEMVLMSIDVPFVVAHDNGASAVALLIPEHRVERHLGTTAATGITLLGGRGLGYVLRDLVKALVKERDQLTGPEFEATCDRAVDLACLAVEGRNDGAGTVDAELREAVLRYIRAHATDQGLTIGAAAAAVGWSARQIQAVLSKTGETFTDAVRAERLDLAHTRLRDPKWSARGIGYIADSVGYSSAASFSTAFRRRFGQSPRTSRGD